MHEPEKKNAMYSLILNPYITIQWLKLLFLFDSHQL